MIAENQPIENYFRVKLIKLNHCFRLFIECSLFVRIFNYNLRMTASSHFQKILWLWLLAGIAAVLVTWPLDASVDKALLAAGNPNLKAFASAFSKIGEGWVIALIGILGMTIFLFLKRTELASKFFFVALTSEVAGLAATILRIFIGRTRPNNHSVPQGIYGVWYHGHWIIGKYAFSSLPSGHAATAVGLAAAAWLIHRGWSAIFFIYALGVMWSRIALAAHHLSDVTASIFLAIIVALLMKRYYLPWNEKIFSQLPLRK
jgi:membrane-associated phospholipid phosphatase